MTPACARCADPLACREYLRLDTVCEPPLPMPPLSERQQRVIRFALWRFINDARGNMNAAAQDKEGRHFKPGAFEAFEKDAQDAERTVQILRLHAARPQAAIPAGLRWLDMPRPLRDALVAYHDRPCDAEAGAVVRAVLAAYGTASPDGEKQEV